MFEDANHLDDGDSGAFYVLERAVCPTAYKAFIDEWEMARISLQKIDATTVAIPRGCGLYHPDT